MERLIEKIFEPAKGVALGKESKNLIRESLLMHIKGNPPYTFFSRIKPVYAATISLLAVVLVVSAVSVEAESALPGDILYPVKIGFNEKIMQTLAFSDEAKTKVNIQLAELRLHEAEQLAVKGKMTKVGQQQINNNFKEKAENVAQAINKLNNEKMYNNAQKTALNFEASLKAHSYVLEKIKESKTAAAPAENRKVEAKDTKDAFDDLINEVNGATAKASISNEVSVMSSLNQSGPADSLKEETIQNHLREAEKSIKDVRDLIGQSDKIDDNTLKQVEGNLSLAEEKVAKGKERIDSGDKDYAGIISNFNRASIIAKQSENLIRTQSSLGIKIDINISNGDDNQTKTSPQ